MIGGKFREIHQGFLGESDIVVNIRSSWATLPPIQRRSDDKIIDASKLKTIINTLKPIELNSFKDGVITEIKGYIPLFKFDYELKLKEDLNKLGIVDVFDANKADLSQLTSEKTFINS